MHTHKHHTHLRTHTPTHTHTHSIMPRIHGLADPSGKKNQENCMVRHEAAEALGAIGMILPKKKEKYKRIIKKSYKKSSAKKKIIQEL